MANFLLFLNKKISITGFSDLSFNDFIIQPIYLLAAFAKASPYVGFEFINVDSSSSSNNNNGYIYNV